MLLRHVMRLDLRRIPAAWADAPGPQGVRFEGPGRTAAELVDAFVTAYPPSPLIADAFRHADHEWSGVGGALLRRACSAAAGDGFGAISLLVTDGNPAMGGYAGLGFEVVESLTVR
jgi:GNAT superfamily N-acetyltransferase